MLKNSLIFAASGLVLAVLGPALLSHGDSDRAPPTQGVAAAPPRQAPSPELAAVDAPRDSFREKTIPADAGGQFRVDALIEGEAVPMLVDTGATMVAISADLADRLGLTPQAGKPKWIVHTANGDSLATPVTLKNIDLGSIYMNDVEALVMDRRAGNVNLLGSSFLKRLVSVEQRNGMLVLRQ